MIDIHSHIIPGIDDGAQTLEDSLAMGRSAIDNGIYKIIATPHHKNGVYENYKDDIVAQVEVLNHHFNEHGIELEVLPGQENRIHGDFLEGVSKGEILTVNDNNKYFLIEFPSGHIPSYASQLFFNIQLAGYIPVIVHPERNKRIIEQPDLLFDFVEKGAYAQLTTGSICGSFGKKIMKFSEQLIEANLVHLLASDAHNISSRGFNFYEAIMKVENQFGKDKSEEFLQNSSHLISGEMLSTDMPMKIKKEK